MRDTNKFHIFFIFRNRLFFISSLFPLPWWSKDLLVENLQVAGDQLREIHLCSSGVNSDLREFFFWVCASRWSKVSVRIKLSLKMRVSSNELFSSRWSHQLTSDPKRCLVFFWKCLQWSCRKAVSVPTFVIGGLWSSTATGGSCWEE